MNPESQPNPVNSKAEESAQPQPEAQVSQPELESSEELNAIAKALMVKLLWSEVGLFDDKRP